MRVFPVLFFLLIFQPFVGHTQAPCRGLQNISSPIKIYLAGKLHTEKISRKELLKNGLEIRVQSYDIKLLAFTLCFDCHSGISNEISCKDYYNPLIERGDNFIEYVRKGDFLVFQCFVLEKGAIKFTTTEVILEVVE